MFEIEKNVEIPNTQMGRPLVYPLPSMEVGDSFFVEGKDVKSISPIVVSHSKKYGKKFTCRTVDGGVRVWRIS